MSSPPHPPNPSPRTGSRAPSPRLAAMGVTGLSGFGTVELLALASGRSLSAAALLVERLDVGGGVTAATPSELVRAGLSPMRAIAFAASCELTRRVLASPPADRWVVRQPGDLAERLVPAMGRLEREELRIAILDTKNAVTALHTVYVGSLAGSPVRVGEVFREAVRRIGAAVVVAHNHPSGDPTPSGEDLRITAELAEAGRLLDIELLDHLVIARDRWVSLRAMGAL